MGCYFLLQGIFLILGLNPSLLRWQEDSVPLSHLEILVHSVPLFEKVKNNNKTFTIYRVNQKEFLFRGFLSSLAKFDLSRLVFHWMDNFLKKFYYLFLALLGLCCCMRAFSSCSEQGLFSSCGAWAPHCSGLPRCRAQALGRESFSSCSTWAQ